MKTKQTQQFARFFIKNLKNKTQENKSEESNFDEFKMSSLR